MMLNLRHACASDAEALVEFTVRRYDLAAEGASEQEWRNLSARWAAALKRVEDPDKPFAMVLIAESRGAIAGVLSMDQPDSTTAELMSWLAPESLLGSAAQQRLLHHAVEILRARGAARAVAWVPVDEHRVRAALSRKGFVPVSGERPPSCYASIERRTPLVLTLEGAAPLPQ